jgi:hypothetical protein
MLVMLCIIRTMASKCFLHQTVCFLYLSLPSYPHVLMQEVSVGGQDVVFKDIIEPLESVSVSITPSDKDDITLYGDPQEVQSPRARICTIDPSSVHFETSLLFTRAAWNAHHCQRIMIKLMDLVSAFASLPIGLQ